MAAVYLPPQAGVCPLSGHWPALCPPSVACCQAAAWRGGDKSPRRPPDNPCSQIAGRRRPARMPPRRVPERPFGSCSWHVSPPVRSILHPFWPARPLAAGGRTGTRIGTHHPIRGPAQGTRPPCPAAAGENTPARRCGRFHPATCGPDCPLERTARPRKDRGPPVAAPPHTGARRDLSARQPSWPGVNPPPPAGDLHRNGTGPLPFGGRGPCARYPATRPHAVRTALPASSRPGTPGGTPGPVGSWRPVAACSIRGDPTPDSAGRHPHPSSPPRRSADTPPPASVSVAAPLPGMPCPCLGTGSAPAVPWGTGRWLHHDTLRRDSALLCV